MWWEWSNIARKAGGCFRYNDKVWASSETPDFNVLPEPGLPLRFLVLFAPSLCRPETAKQNKIKNSKFRVWGEEGESERRCEYRPLGQSWYIRERRKHFWSVHRGLMQGPGLTSNRWAERSARGRRWCQSFTPGRSHSHLKV